MQALIVDDHQLIQQAVSNVLYRLDHQVQIVLAGDCDSALEIATVGTQEPDIVLLGLADTY